MTPPAEWRELAAGGADEGQRDCTVAKLCGHFLRRFVDPFVVLELMQCWNATRCRRRSPRRTSYGSSIRLPARSCSGVVMRDKTNIDLLASMPATTACR